MEFLSKVFDTSDFPPRWQCGNWTDGHGWLHVLSDLGVWSAYVAIPCVLIYYIIRRKDLPFRLIFLLFGAFILFCGTTHLMEAAIFWWPAYRLAGLIKLATAVVSWGTVLALVPVTPQVLAMRTADKLEREIAAREAAETALQKANDDLAGQVERLRASEERFRLLVEGAQDHAILLLDPDGVVSSWNSGAERLLQYSEQDIVGRHVSSFYSDEDRNAGRAEIELQTASTEGRYEDEGWRIRKDGTQFWANVVVSKLVTAEGAVRGFTKIMRDMTVRRNAEENNRRLLEEAAARKAAEANAELIWAQRERLRVTLQSIGDGVIATDASGVVNLLNTVAEGLTGWTNADATGRPLQEVFQIQNEHTHEPAENPVSKCLSERRIVALANHTVLIARNGSARAIDDSAAPIRDEYGNVIGAVLVFRDITERKRLEVELKLRADQLAEADRRKNVFLATLAHELRNPLASIRNVTHILRMSQNSQETLSETRGILDRQVTQMVRLVDDLMDISRISRGKVELRKEPLELATAVHHAVEISKPLIEEGKHSLTVDLPSDPIFVIGDLTRLAQVFSNLLNNAAKFTPAGGKISLTVHREGEHAVVSVRDTGIGIPKNMLREVFTMFAQLDQSNSQAHRGLGIGLSLVRSLVEMHGGDVQANSDGMNQGATMIVRLPQTKPGPTSHVETAEPINAVAKKVLVVDDNVDSAESLASLVRLMGHQVRVAHEGPTALRIFEEFAPDVALLDIGLPGMDGYELARRLRALPAGQHALLVAQTGWGQEDDKRRSREAGFNEHLVKPIAQDTLIRLLADRPVDP